MKVGMRNVNCAPMTSAEVGQRADRIDVIDSSRNLSSPSLRRS